MSQSKHGEPNTKDATTKKYTEKNDTEKIQIKYATKIWVCPNSTKMTEMSQLTLYFASTDKCTDVVTTSF